MTKQEIDEVVEKIIAKRGGVTPTSGLGSCHILDRHGNRRDCKDRMTEGECGVLGEVKGVAVRWFAGESC